MHVSIIAGQAVNRCADIEDCELISLTKSNPQLTQDIEPLYNSHSRIHLEIAKHPLSVEEGPISPPLGLLFERIAHSTAKNECLAYGFIRESMLRHWEGLVYQIDTRGDQGLLRTRLLSSEPRRQSDGCCVSSPGRFCRNHVFLADCIESFHRFFIQWSQVLDPSLSSRSVHQPGSDGEVVCAQSWGVLAGVNGRYWKVNPLDSTLQCSFQP